MTKDATPVATPTPAVAAAATPVAAAATEKKVEPAPEEKADLGAALEEIAAGIVEVARRSLAEANIARAMGSMPESQERWLCELAGIPYAQIVPGSMRLYAPGRVEVQLKGSIRQMTIRGVVSV